MYHLRWQDLSLRMTEDEFIRLARLLKIAYGQISAKGIMPSQILDEQPSS